MVTDSEVEKLFSADLVPLLAGAFCSLSRSTTG